MRIGVQYGPGNIYTGTCAVPAAASVLLGVPVGATTGTATIAAADIRSAVGLTSANLDTQLSSLSSGQTTINNNVNTRLAASSYTAPPSAATNASAVRTELSAELGRIDATVSSRSTYSGADTSGTTTLLSRLTSARAGNLDNLDATISSRPVITDIVAGVWGAATRTLTTAIDNSATIAAAVWGSEVDDYTTNGTFGAGVLVGSSAQREVAVTGSHHVAADIHELQADVITAGDFAPGAFDDVRTSIGMASANLDTQLNALPTAAENATAVRSELATELGRLDATVSSRLAPAGTLARVTLVDTTTTVTNSSQVDNAAIADAVRTELTPELARLANAATTQEVGDIVEEAMNP